MNKKFARIARLIALTMLAPSAYAESPVDGDIEAGNTRSVTCAACHGANGISQNPLWPNLAGQGAKYLVEQLVAWKDGSRQNALMSSQAVGLSEEDIRNLAVYFESRPMAVQAVSDPSLIDRGEALYRGGNAQNGVPACIACHGPTGRGNIAAAYPALNGQHAAYTAKTLGEYKSGARQSLGPAQIMNGIAERLSQKDIEALAAYVQGLRPLDL